MTVYPRYRLHFTGYDCEVEHNRLLQRRCVESCDHHENGGATITFGTERCYPKDLDVGDEILFSLTTSGPVQEAFCTLKRIDGFAVNADKPSEWVTLKGGCGV